VHDVILKSQFCDTSLATSGGGTVNKKYVLLGKRYIVALVVISGLALAPVGVNAAGMGGITVHSMLGQPLRAEVKVTASSEELLGMVAHLASREIFTQTGVAYAPALSGLRFSLDKAEGGAVVRITSDQPINDPYLDFLVELSWPAGRLTRGYTVLLDPPEVAAQALYRQATVDGAAPAAVSDGVATGEIVGEHVVKAGETLGRIARDNMPAGVTMEQMLVALYQNNPNAFAGNNMNRLRRGAVLKIPGAVDVAAVSVANAKQVFRAQSASWRNYRNKLAAAAGGGAESDGRRSVSGPVSAKVETISPSTERGDRVAISRSDDQSVGTRGVSEEDVIASDKELQESMSKLKELEKLVANLKELVSQKDASIRKSQKELDSIPDPTVKPVVQPGKSSQAADAGFKISSMAAYKVTA
jgi:pilus assembly protein FimV